MPFYRCPRRQRCAQLSGPCGSYWLGCLQRPEWLQKVVRASARPPPVSGLFAGVGFGMLDRGLGATRSAFGGAEPNRRQILVGVVARANLPAMDIGAQRD